MIIYKITCLKTNKIYIGQSKDTAERRFKQHIKSALNNQLNTHLARAIRKYGPEAFKVETIDKAESQEELTEKEYYYIKVYNSCNSEIGYNETDCGNRCGGNTYKYKTEEEMIDIKNKISKKNTGANNGMARGVKCFDLKTSKTIYFGSVFECARFFNRSYTGFVRVRCNDYADPYEGRWMFAWENDDFKYPEIFDSSTRRGIKIQLTSVIDGSSITLPSKNRAGKFLNVPATSILDKAIINDYQIKIL